MDTARFDRLARPIAHTRDRRGMSGIAWLLAWIFFQLLALVIYLFIRPSRPTRSA